MAHIERTAATGCEVHCFNTTTNQVEVSYVLHDLVYRYRETKQIWVVSGTHGMADGTVDASCHHPDFKYEDRDISRVTSRLINAVDFHHLSERRWDLMQHKNVLVLAWCYSEQWFQKNPF